MKRPASLYDLLVAWQAGEIGYREAMSRAGVDTLDELYDAAKLSGVTIRGDLTAAELSQASLVASLLRDQPRRVPA